MKIRLLTMGALVEETFSPQVIHDYCRSCENYNMHFACPEHRFNIPHFLDAYPFVLVISHRIPVKQDEYFFWRDILEPVLMSAEKRFQGQVLLAGSCRNCQFCFDKGAQECESPQLMRYSLESLGFDVKKLLEHFFKEELLFKSDELHLVYGILLKQRPDPIELQELEEELRELSSQS